MSAPALPGARFPVGAWISPPPKTLSYPKSYVEDVYFRWAAEAGINALYALYEDVSRFREETFSSLKLCEKYGIGYYLNDPAMRAEENFDAKVFGAGLGAYRDYPAFAGLHVKDEPGVKQFAQLRDKKRLFLSLCPDKMFYVNLLPLYATPYHLLNGMWTAEVAAAQMDYETYLDSYLETVRPQFLSYDFYPMRGEFPRVEPGYFRQLELVHRRAQAAGIPFWVFVQTCSFADGVRVPTAAEIAWQVNTALACGAKGIQYFTYFQPADSELERFAGGMIDREGNKTPAYDAVSDINRQIAACDEYLLPATRLGLRFIGASPDPVPVKESAAMPAVFGKHLLAGDFAAPGRKFLYLVNNSLSEPDTAELTSARFVASVGRGKRTDLDALSLSLRLCAGEGVLIEYKEESR